MANAIRFKGTNVPRQPRESGRLKVVSGPDRGALYVLVSNRFTIGRGEDCDIVISDLKASRLHGMGSLTAGAWTLKDGGSSNGIVVNGKSVRELRLKLGDVFTLGETLLEYVSPEAGTMLLRAPAKRLEEVLLEQKKMALQRGRVAAIGLASVFQSGPSGSPSADGSSSKARPIVMGVVGLGVLAFLLMPNGEVKAPKQAKKEGDKKLADYLPSVGETNKTATAFFKEGYRDYLVGNFNRARNQFETVLQIVPNHTLATLYLQNCVRAINSQVRFHFETAKKAEDSGKYKEAKAHYEAVLRLLYKDQSSADYIKAKDYLEKLMKDLVGPPK